VTLSNPRAIAARALGVDIASLGQAEHIKHGLTNESWRVRSPHGAVIVRLSNGTEDLLQIDRASEAKVLTIVGAAGLGPQVLMCDPGSRVLVTRDLGNTWNEADAHIAANISRIGSVLRHLHALDVPFDVRTVDLTRTLRGYLRVLDERGDRSNLTHPTTRMRGENAALALGHNSVACLCHNDVYHLNIIDDGSVRLIDWEYSGIGERMFDLASFCVYHGLDRQEREHLLDAYLIDSQPNALQRLELACWVFEYVRDVWSEVRKGV
jgi:thiamine kinase-like enzyme